MAGKNSGPFVLSTTGAVLILTGVFILAFSSHYLSLQPVLYLATLILAAIILAGALLTAQEGEKKIVAGSAIVLGLSTIVFCFSLLPVFLPYAGRYVPYIFMPRSLGTSGLIDFLGGFIPSTIGIVGVILCVAGAMLELRRKHLPSSPYLSKVQVSETEESIICPECGAVNSASYKFCFKCGARLKPVKPRKTEEALTVEAVVCPVCGRQTTGGSKFCSQCGTPLSGGEQLPPPPPDIESRLEKLEERIERLEKTLEKAGRLEGEGEIREEGEAGESIFGEYTPN